MNYKVYKPLKIERLEDDNFLQKHFTKRFSVDWIRYWFKYIALRMSMFTVILMILASYFIITTFILYFYKTPVNVSSENIGQVIAQWNGKIISLYWLEVSLIYEYVLAIIFVKHKKKVLGTWFQRR